MIRLKTQFMVADGSRSRWVERSAATGDLVTIEETEAEAGKPKRGPPGVVFDGATGRGAGVRERSDFVERNRERFAKALAGELNARAAKGTLDRLVVVAPSRTLRAILSGMSEQAQERLKGALAKDLTKTPDHELVRWLGHFEHE